MASILIYNYNNYYNRRVKGQNNTLSDYGEPIYIESGNALNFNPADGVNTTFTAGKLNNSYTGKGDYFIYSEDNVSITSRWFVIEADRTRNGQYKLQLRRDVIVDSYDAILSADTFIKKATIPGSSPFILNQEPIPVNQIKQKEQPLYDETGCAWIVGYIDRKYAADVDKKELKFTVNAAPAYDYTKDNWTFFQQYGLYVYGHYTSRTLSGHPVLTDAQTIITTRYEKLYWDWEERSQAIINEGLAQSGLVIKDGDKYFKVKAKLTNAKKYPTINLDKDGKFLYTYYTEQFGSTNAFVLVYDVPELILTLEEIPSTVNLDVSIPGKTESESVGIRFLRPGLTDAPYDMFCMPYMDGELVLEQPTGNISVNVTKSMALAIAQSLALEFGSTEIYDLQLLPYCPLAGFVKTDTGLKIDRFRHLDSVVGTQSTPYTYYNCLFWCQQSHGTKNIVLDDMPSYTNRKMANQCDVYRLVSPNYNGQFEFNLAQNNTPTLPYFNVDYTYMPYNSYIHVNPYFSGLYGADFNDARGLICQGDFSIAYLSDAWKNYQIQNKNYQNIFDRQIQNMSTNYKIQTRQQSIESALSAALTGASAGVVSGSVIGGGLGADVSALGGVADLMFGQERFNESLRYAKDVHTYQLDNIKALPYSIAKSTSITENNKLVPILETFSCTNEEKIAIANEIRTRGMQLGVVGHIEDYIENSWSYEGITDEGFIRGDIIHIDTLADDTHMANAIADEINKGVYFK